MVYDELKALFDRDIRYAQWGGDVEIFQHSSSQEKGDTVRVRIYTDTNCYAITACRRPDGSGYLGCIASTRKPRAGEDWTRGNDLPDGPLNAKTWKAILGAIVGYELVKVHALAQRANSETPSAGPSLEAPATEAAA